MLDSSLTAASCFVAGLGSSVPAARRSGSMTRDSDRWPLSRRNSLLRLRRPVQGSGGGIRARFIGESGGYRQRDVMALIRDRQRRSAQKLGRAHMLLNVEEGQAADESSRRKPIPREVRRAVFERDGGRCVECGSNFDLQYDHVLPLALGGANTLENLQLLCGPCNREKGADL